MDPYEGASIYMIDIFGSFWATLTAYYFGIVLVLTAGLIATNLLDRVTRKGSGDGNDKKVDTDTAENTEINKKSDSHTDGVTDDSSFSPEGGV